MLGDGLGADRERLGQLAHGGLALGQPAKDGPAGGVGEGVEGPGQLVDRHGYATYLLCNLVVALGYGAGGRAAS